MTVEDLKRPALTAYELDARRRCFAFALRTWQQQLARRLLRDGVLGDPSSPQAEWMLDSIREAAADAWPRGSDLVSSWARV